MTVWHRSRDCHDMSLTLMSKNRNSCRFSVKSKCTRLSLSDAVTYCHCHYVVLLFNLPLLCGQHWLDCVKHLPKADSTLPNETRHVLLWGVVQCALGQEWVCKEMQRCGFSSEEFCSRLLTSSVYR